jgi:amino acid adenylation domain-containing protein
MKNDTACLHHLIAAQALRTPDAAALAFEGTRLSYAELERRAERLAGRLASLGAGPETLVGLFVERSWEMVVGILGVLKAGAAYVPIDTAYPPERVAFMLEDAGVRVVLTQSALAARLGAGPVETVALDQFDWNSSQAEVRAAVRPEHAAYVIYTSGSTGRPKGVCVEHRNIVNYVLGVAERLRLEPGMQHAMVSTIAADLGNTVLFPALATGGCLHVLSQARAESEALLSQYFAGERIDVLKIVPSHLAALQSGNNPERLMPRRRLVLGGEASRLDWIERLRALAPQCEIHNHYGPTETTVGVLTYRVEGALPATRSGTLPLGRPLPGSIVQLFDAHQRPVPAGEKGELCIGGRGVARGYLGRPDLTADKFVVHAAYGRMYRSGDLARMLPDGSFEFCGRIDHQVKLHGYRVELGEIESALREHGAVQDAVALVREEQLVAFVSRAETRPGPFADELTPAGLREHLKARLPNYMVPSALVLMERLPLTANGKVDRQGLAKLAPARPAPSAAVAARTPTEEALVAIWRELLGVDSVGIDDDVFDLGAHSLMAMKALTRICHVFEVNLALRNLFEHPTIAGFARLIDGLSLAGKPDAARGGGQREELLL